MQQCPIVLYAQIDCKRKLLFKPEHSVVPSSIHLNFVLFDVEVAAAGLCISSLASSFGRVSPCSCVFSKAVSPQIVVNPSQDTDPLRGDQNLRVLDRLNPAAIGLADDRKLPSVFVSGCVRVVENHQIRIREELTSHSITIVRLLSSLTVRTTPVDKSHTFIRPST